VSLEDRQDIVVSKLKAINESLTQAETELAKARNRCEEVEQLSSQGVVLEVIPAIGADAGVVVAKNKVAEIEARIALLELRYKAKHPSLIAAQADLAEARSAYQETCKEARVRMDQDYQMAQSNVEGLRAALKAQERQALELSRVLVEYNELKRNAEADQELYESILSRMRETDLVGKLETTNIRLNDRAHVPSAPFKPRRTVTMLRGAGVGGVLGVLLVFVVHLMDDRIRRVEDFELLLGIPVLAMVPSLSGGGAAEYAAVSLADPESAASEAFRGMRASLLLDPAGRKARRIMVVSASASEGKSLVACNLAATFAQNGERTLLIDADLRRPSIHKLMKLDGRRGLAHLLSGKATWDEVICHARHEHLSVLTGAGAPRDPSPLLASARLRPVLDRAGQAYDRVIIDCPPLFGVSDPLLLLPHVDGVVLVARYNRTHRRAIEEATQKLFDGDTPVLGAVINGVEAGSYSYYYYRYGYNHYYGRDPKRIAGEEAC
jgi:succinoglycan biosynthesis transport protein ExoP